jgi:hypothetical protein
VVVNAGAEETAVADRILAGAIFEVRNDFGFA